MGAHVDPPALLGMGAFGMRRNWRSEPVVQPTVAYGRCVTGNGGVLSVLTMYSRSNPADGHREKVIWILPVAGGGEARLCGMVNVSEALINPVTEKELKLLVKALAKRRAIGSSTWHFGDADTTMVGEETPPNPCLLSTRNWVNPYRCLMETESHGEVRASMKLRSVRRGRLTARKTVAGAGRGGRKKRRLVCNGRDRGLDVTPRKTGLTCDWSFLSIVSTRIHLNRLREGGYLCCLPLEGCPVSTSLNLNKREVSKMSDICKAQMGDACSVTSDVAFNWSSIDWKRVEQNVRCLQIRIAKATREKKWRKVKALQRFLTRSFGGRAMAVRRATENTGKRTPGVDGDLWSEPQTKWDAISNLSRDGYKPSPLKRVCIPKTNGKKRPLGIPTMKDRAQQALYLLALAPVAETTGDPNSYGFRIARSTHDAIGQVKNLLDKKGSAQWVLEGDIKGCFDHISHSWLETHVPMDRGMLVKWLKAGVMEYGQFSPTLAGTPQGGIISPTLANLALDGLEDVLANRFGGRDRRHKQHARNKVSLVRYADDVRHITGRWIPFTERRGRKERDPWVNGLPGGESQRGQ